MAASTMRKGRAVSVTERPVYEHCARLFHARVLHGFWAFERDDWAVRFSADAPVLSMTFDEMKDTLRQVDPGGCVWDIRRPSKPGKADVLRVARRLLNALVDGTRDETLIAEAHEILATA
jgi:hypothetical protein